MRESFAVFFMLVAFASAAGAQVRTRVTPQPQRDTSVKDTTKRAAKDLVKWAEPDSVMLELLARKGYEPTKYQGDSVNYDASSKTLYLQGKPAAVQRATSTLVGDTIVYNDSTNIIVARGDTVVLRDSTQGSGDVVARGSMTYNVAERRGQVENITTSIESGETWFVKGVRASFVSDTTAGGSTAFYARNGIITSCDDSIPDYHFAAKEVKMISKNIMVARPAVLYIGDVPVMWLPFIFQDMRSGRRSGILTPRFGVSELFRNSPSYRRHLENLGYYFALNDYMDMQFALDWRSGARPTPGDPGWVRWNGEWRYRWLDRFITGRFAVSHLAQRDGTSNTQYSWGHQQDFNATTHLTTNINYVTSTAIQRRTTFDPRQVLATIHSQASFQKQLGPAAIALGGSRTQYPGRDEVNQDFPNFSISVPSVALSKFVAWTPSLSVTNQQQFKLDQAGEFPFRFFTKNGVLDSTRVKPNARTTHMSFETPIKFGNFIWQNSFRVADQENSSAVTIAVVDPLDSAKRINRVFGRTFSTEIDWQTGITLPSLFTGKWNLAPNVSIVNVDPAGFWVRTEQSGGAYVHQSKRLLYGVSIAPTFYGLLPGFGPISRIRHTINPVVTFGFAPPAHVNPEFLRALNRTQAGYLGALGQSSITLNLSHNFEAKLKTSDTATVQPPKIKLLSMNFSPLTYDFERARKGHNGFTTDDFRYDVTSDLFPGLRLGVQYSLFEGSVLSDSAKFKPFRQGLDASFSVNGRSGIFAAINRIFGSVIPESNPQIERLAPSDDDALAQRVASTPVAGSYSRNRQFAVPETQNWQATFTFSSSRQRPPSGSGLVVEQDPTAVCSAFRINPVEYEQCLLIQRTNPQSAQPIGRLTSGGPFVRIPPRETLASQMSFNLTPMWSGTWGTVYDFQANQFASHSVTLQRKLHDWRAIFAFTQAPNGNFAFNFFISLNAQPDIKFDYDRNTYRRTTQ